MTAAFLAGKAGTEKKNVVASVKLQGVDSREIEVFTGLFIDNEFMPSLEGSTLEVENPSSGTTLAIVSAAQKEDVEKAVKSAKAAFEQTWKLTSPKTRGLLLLKLADLISRDADELAAIESLDAGVLFADSKALSVNQAVDTLRYFAGWADKITGQLMDIPEGIAYTRREALGVCAAIVPWNAPLMITCWKLAPAIAAGNTLVIKTPELAPLYGQKLANLIIEAGFPPGVINILCGEGRIAGQALAENMFVKKLAFTGSTAVGRNILRASANTNLKKVSLELGGKGPSIVFSDADFENAIFWTTLGITAHNGQICAAGSRIYVQDKIYDKFLKSFSEKSTTAIHGDPILPSTSKGPIISRAQRDKILQHISNAKQSGTRLLHGGDSLGDSGNFVENTAFADVEDTNSLMTEEIFGPVAAIAKFSTEQEVLAKANNSDYGLAAAVFTQDISRATRMGSALETGMVTINSWGNLHANTPFGGLKQSGFGRDMGEDALEGWTAVKTVKINILAEPHTVV